MTKTTKVQVNVQLEGEEAEQFLKFKENELLRTNSQAGYKLMIQRLRELNEGEAA